MLGLYLASTSPRRAELLRQIGVEFQPLAVSVDESVKPGEPPEVYVERLARAKAQAAQPMLTELMPYALGADTTVVLEGQILGKPNDREHGLDMLRALSGRTHRVLTAIALSSQQQCLSQWVATEVTFRRLSEAEIMAYWNTGEPRDKAGAYGIQGLGAVFVQHIQGSYSAVVGLPLCETAQLLNSLGIPCWEKATY
ncbi:septum formation protein [Azomonas agilis]|uniref:dTTP/UTP pyrophosphatase n=1 Tax=Azomonas agilis TaxID=116849 RepID=A0A562J1Q0_9GAMM|nr:Maf family protein [Azomonas agilis]TWH76735.1 septum formation protein [Azomonas agilis]